MRIRIYGKEADVDLASEVLCVVSNVSFVKTFPDEEAPGSVTRYLTVDFVPGVLEDLGVIKEPLANH